MYYLYVYVVIYILRVSIGSQKNTYYMQCRLDKVLLAFAVHGEGRTACRGT
jgi:hypothetical protein